MEHYTLPHRHNQSMSQLMSHLPNIEEFQTTADIFKQLSDPTRIRIFWILCHCEECVINIASMMEMSSPAVAHHLRLLRSSGLIESRRDGKETYYRAVDSKKNTNASSYDRKDHGYFLHKQRRINQNLTQIYRF